jgi:hypothetical protein
MISDDMPQMILRKAKHENGKCKNGSIENIARKV